MEGFRKRPFEQIGDPAGAGTPRPTPAPPAPEANITPGGQEQFPARREDPVDAYITPQDAERPSRPTHHEFPAERAAGHTALSDLSVERGSPAAHSGDTRARRPSQDPADAGLFPDTGARQADQARRTTDTELPSVTAAGKIYQSSHASEPPDSMSTRETHQIDQAPPYPSRPSQRSEAPARVDQHGRAVAQPDNHRGALAVPGAEEAERIRAQEQARHVVAEAYPGLTGPKVSAVGKEAKALGDRIKAAQLNTMLRDPRASTAVFLDFAPQPVDAEPSPWTRAADGQRLHIYEGNIATPKGILETLTPRQFAEVFSHVAGAEDAKTRAGYETIIEKISSTFAGEMIDANTGDRTTITAPAVKIRDVLRVWCGAGIGPEYPGETPWSLSKKELLELLNGRPILAPDQKEALKPLFEPLREVFDKAVPDSLYLPRGEHDPRWPASATNKLIYKPPSGLTVINSSVTGFREGLRIQTGLAVNTVLAAITASRRSDMPDFASLENLDRALKVDPDAVMELLGNLRELRIPLLVRVGTVNEETAELIRGGAIGLTPVDGPEADVLARLSKRVTRDDVTSISNAAHGNLGTTKNHKREGGRASLEGASVTGGTSFDRSVGRTIGSGPAAREDEINNAARSGLVAVIRADGEPGDVFDIRTRSRMGPFAPDDPNKQFDVDSTIKQIQGATAEGGESDLSQPTSGGARRGGQSPPQATPQLPAEMNEPRKLPDSRSQRKVVLRNEWFWAPESEGGGGGDRSSSLYNPTGRKNLIRYLKWCEGRYLGEVPASERRTLPFEDWLKQRGESIPPWLKAGKAAGRAFRGVIARELARDAEATRRRRGGKG